MKCNDKRLSITSHYGAVTNRFGKKARNLATSWMNIEEKLIPG